MNWTEGNLYRHARGRGWSRDRSRQKRIFASARSGKTPSAPNATSETSPFFSISTLKESPACPERNGVVSPPHTKRRKTSPVVSYPGDDIDARRRRLLERPDWTGISADGALHRDRDEIAPRHFETSRRATPDPRLHHPKPVRYDGAQLVQSLESHTRPRSVSTTHSRRESTPSVQTGPPRSEENPYPRVAASAGTAETESTDNLLPLSDTLPDVSVRLDILDPACRDGDCGARVLGGEDDVSLAALLSSLSEESLGSGGISPACRKGPTTGRESRNRRGDFTPEGMGCNVEDSWLDFIFDDEEEVNRGAFEVARRDAARVLIPSISSEDSLVVECDSGSGCGGWDRTTCGTGS